MNFKLNACTPPDVPNLSHRCRVSDPRHPESSAMLVLAAARPQGQPAAQGSVAASLPGGRTETRAPPSDKFAGWSEAFTSGVHRMRHRLFQRCSAPFVGVWRRGC